MRKLKFIFLIAVIVFVIYSSSIPVKSDESKISVIVQVENKTIDKTFLGIKIGEEKIDRENIIDEVGEENVRHKFSSSEAFSAELTEKQLERISKKGIKIEKMRYFDATLQDSTILVNATRTWALQVSGTNLTGEGQTVCVVDTGTNYSHASLIGRNATACNIDCVTANCVEDCSITDLNGHGTHVSGIVAASGVVNGVAKGASIIGLKVFPGTGSSGAGVDDVVSAIDWCVNNASVYNISVITMSLGDGENNTAYCNSDYPTITSAINAAVAKNISVTIASGNNGNSSGISGPACIQNATPVSATDKSDNIASYSQRGLLVKLMAPGSSITSTYYDGSYVVMSGTSMATPHVAGAIAVINQFLSSTSQTKTPKEIEAILNNTGKKITDTTGLNFSRINLYSAIISLDNISPDVSLSSPANNHLNISQNQTFSCNATDLALKNVTFFLWNSTSSIINQTSLLINGSSYNYDINLTNISYGTYKWNCLFYDENSNSAFSAGNFTIIIGGISAILISPSNNNYTNVNLINFTCQASSETSYSLTNTTFYLWNSTSLVYNETKNVSGTLNSSIFNYTFLYESSFLWGCLSVNNASNSSMAGNYTINYDITKPNITLIEPFPADETSNSAAKIVYYNVSDNFNISKCNLIANNIIVASNFTAITNSTNNISYSFSPGTYSWQVNCSDIAGNQENSSSHSFTIIAPVQQISASGGGGGGGGASTGMTYTLTSSQVSSGYTKDLGKSDKVKFTIFDEKQESHELTIEQVGINFVNVTLRSEPVRIRLGIGQSIKLNLTSPDYYDLYIKLDSISNNKATLTIQTIHETIPKSVSGGKATESELNVSVENKEDGKPKTKDIKLINYSYIGLYILMILIVLGLGYALFKRFRKGIKVKFEFKIKE